MSPPEVHSHQTSVQVELTADEARILSDLIAEACDDAADGGSIPPVHWRTAANKMSAAARWIQAQA